MLRLREIMTTDVVTVTPETTLREAMEALARRHVSGAPVVQGSILVGVVTAMDLLAFASALPGVPTERDPHAAVDDADDATEDADVENGLEAAGPYFADMWDDAGADTSVRFSSTGGPEWNVLEEHDVSEIMTRTPLVTLPPEGSAELAAAVMCEHGIHRVLVTDGDRLVGVVSALDITRAAAGRRFTSRTFVFERGGTLDGAAGTAPRSLLGARLSTGDERH